MVHHEALIETVYEPINRDTCCKVDYGNRWLKKRIKLFCSFFCEKEFRNNSPLGFALHHQLQSYRAESLHIPWHQPKQQCRTRRWNICHWQRGVDKIKSQWHMHLLSYLFSGNVLNKKLRIQNGKRFFCDEKKYQSQMNSRILKPILPNDKNTVYEFAKWKKCQCMFDQHAKQISEL